MKLTPFKYLLEYRVEAAANMLLNTNSSITDIALQNGFETSSYFSRTFKTFMQCSPTEYRDTTRRNLSKSKKEKN
jgi:AraC-like DNA-binding protein